MENELVGEVALVTGGSSGIGKAACLRLAKAGAKVAVVASSRIKKAQEVVATIRSSGGEALALVGDVRKISDIKAFVAQTLETFGTIDILVTSAGVCFPTIAGDTTEDTYDWMADINLKGLYFTINEVVTIMKAKRSGKIITLSSNAAFVGLVNIPVYCALKSAVSMLTRSLALQLAPFNININAVAPGNTSTPMNEDIRTKSEYAEALEKVYAQTPSTCKYADPTEIAEMIFFLSTEKARSMHGSTVLMDEGQSAGLL